jgi:succinylglutamate desuccinylase
VRGRGQFVALSGNTRALNQHVRFLEDDLNRLWSPERIRDLKADPHPEFLGPEEQECLELLGTLNETLGEAAGPVYLIDLHTTSADGSPFATIGDTLRNRNFALRFGLPVILGLEEQIDGPMLEYMNNRGVVTMCVEGGRHDRAASIDNHEAVLWIALAETGILDPADVPDLEGARSRLRDAARDAPRIMEVRHRRSLRAGDGFAMRPGFTNFQPVVKGQHLADDHRGKILAHEDGILLMPLYQGLGDDGYFLGRKVKRAWLRLSTALRKLRVDTIMPLLPGVWRHPEREHTLIVNTKVARFYPLEIFHLLGYRKRARLGPVLLVSRRRFDVRVPRNGWG